jgi:nucleoside-diphosphate-sugar epimerase
MTIAVTGATGFLGRYLVAHLTGLGHHCRCWYRPSSDRSNFPAPANQITWIAGHLRDADAARGLVAGCDAVVHAALDHRGPRFRGGEGHLIRFLEANFLGTIQLIEAAHAAGAGRFIFISTCAVHEVILDDRPLDETHPLWPTSHYGAHKAALEAFVHSFGLGEGYPICAVRPTGIYGLAHPPRASKWYELVRKIVRGEDVECRRGGKEVHAADVARAVAILLSAEGITGQSYNCYDRYISEHEVATIAQELTGSRSQVRGERPVPQHQIVTAKIEALGMRFGGWPRLEQTVRELVEAVRRED